jgi:DNA-binding NarL/FixJ family response regulator
LVLLADPDDEFRPRVAGHLRRCGFVVREVETAEDVLGLARVERPVAAVVEVTLPDMSGYEVCRVLREEFGDEVAIVFISKERTDSRDRVAGLLLGADDYLSKPFVPDELIARMLNLVRRRSIASREESEVISALTAREREVLGLLADGLEQVDIAQRLVISPKTVAGHIERILAKLGVHSRAHAVAVAYQHGIETPSSAPADQEPLERGS